MKRQRHVPFLCPRCGKPLQVTETRQRQGSIWRRRTCPDKHAQVQTIEAIQAPAA